MATKSIKSMETVPISLNLALRIYELLYPYLLFSIAPGSTGAYQEKNTSQLRRTVDENAGVRYHPRTAEYDKTRTVSGMGQRVFLLVFSKGSK